MVRKKEYLTLVEDKKAVPLWKRCLTFTGRLLFLAVLLALLSYGATFFRISEISMSGDSSIGKEDIINLSDLKNGKSMFLISEKKVARLITEQFPELKEVTVERQWPDRVLVTLEERKLAAYVYNDEGYWLIDEEAVCFAREEKPTGDYPLITGIDHSYLEPGRPLGCPLRRETLQAFFYSLSAEEFPEVSAINLTDNYNLIINTAEGCEIWLGDSRDMAEKLMLVRETMPFIADQAETKLDVRAGSRLVVSSSALIIGEKEEEE